MWEVEVQPDLEAIMTETYHKEDQPSQREEETHFVPPAADQVTAVHSKYQSHFDSRKKSARLVLYEGERILEYVDAKGDVILYSGETDNDHHKIEGFDIINPGKNSGRYHLLLRSSCGGYVARWGAIWYLLDEKRNELIEKAHKLRIKRGKLIREIGASVFTERLPDPFNTIQRNFISRLFSKP